jgi:hypothetical protein
MKTIVLSTLCNTTQRRASLGSVAMGVVSWFEGRYWGLHGVDAGISSEFGGELGKEFGKQLSTIAIVASIQPIPGQDNSTAVITSGRFRYSLTPT